jgi:ribosome-binding protein aMBF1 (putative translation factor)
MHPLAEARKKKGMTQVKLARELEIDPSIVRHVEAGRVQPYPRFRRLCAEIFDVAEESLFGHQTSKKAASNPDA